MTHMYMTEMFSVQLPRFVFYAILSFAHFLCIPNVMHRGNKSACLNTHKILLSLSADHINREVFVCGSVLLLFQHAPAATARDDEDTFHFVEANE